MNEKKIIIDAEDVSQGRLASFAAKKALEGNEIIVINSEKAVITGNKIVAIKRYKELRAKGGHSRKGPRYSKLPYKMLKWAIRGMLPDHRRGIGKQALRRIKCYDGIPTEFENQKIEKLLKIKTEKYISLKELSEKL